MNLDIAIIRSQIPEHIFRVADALLSGGFQAYLVGGVVRDLLLGRTPKDYDLATNALPEEIVKIFPSSVSINAKFGTILVIEEGREGERFDVEVTTFRREENYFGGRWPAKVEFASAIEEDLARRDFTINAMAISFAALGDGYLGEEGLLEDPFAGKVDLQSRLIRAVRDPEERFAEDGLRAFRACRLASELEFNIDIATKTAIKQAKSVAAQISMERIRDEFVKMLRYSPKPSAGIELLRELDLLDIFIPELLENIGIVQPEWHTDDVYTHLLKTLDLAEDSIKIAAIMHDIGKGRTRSEDETGVHFYSHDVVSADMAAEIMRRMKFSSAQIKKVTTLVRWHMFYYPSADWRKTNLGLITEHAESDGGWTDGAIRRFIRNVGEDYIDDLFKLRVADASSNPKSDFHQEEIVALQERIAEVRAKDMALKVTDLVISGEDLVQIGVEKGPQMGAILNQLLEEVLDEPAQNNREYLLMKAKGTLEKTSPLANGSDN